MSSNRKPLENKDLTNLVLRCLSNSNIEKAKEINKFFKSVVANIESKEIEQLNKKTVEDLCVSGEKKEETALLILRTSELLNRLGRHDESTLFWIWEKARNGSPSEYWLNQHNGHYLARIGKAHILAAKYILAHPDILKRLGSDDQKALKEKINPPHPILAHSL